MATLGSYTLLAAFVACAYAIVISVAGARRRSLRMIESGIGAFYVVTALMTLASSIIIHAFVTQNYTIRYVDQYSDSVQPLFYKITSYWGGLDGSIMFWVFLLSVFGAIAVRTNRERQRELIPYVVAVIGAVQLFFLFVMIVHKDPFATYLTQVPVDGRGLNPLLQNLCMANYKMLRDLAIRHAQAGMVRSGENAVIYQGKGVSIRSIPAFHALDGPCPPIRSFDTCPFRLLPSVF